MPRISGTSQNFDHSSMAEAFSYPGIDPRQHVSFATVARGDESNPAVEFDDEYGQVFVNVKLHPTLLHVRARVASQVGGNGEGEHFPFVENDEVLVVIPQGDERSGCVIIGRLNNGYDKFPRSVAGQDATKNNFGFRRLRTPYILETASSYMIRSAVSKSFYSIDTSGSHTISDGNNNMLHIGADFVGMASGDNKTLLQLDLHKNQIRAEADGTRFELDGSESSFISTGTLAIGTSGLPGTQHAISLEQVVNLFVNFIYMLNSLGGPIASALTSATGPLFVPTFPANLITFIQTWLTNSAAPIPPTPTTGGGNYASLAIGPLVVAALSAQVPDVLGTGFLPGVGRAGLKF